MQFSDHQFKKSGYSKFNQGIIYAAAEERKVPNNKKTIYTRNNPYPGDTLFDPQTKLTYRIHSRIYYLEQGKKIEDILYIVAIMSPNVPSKQLRTTLNTKEGTFLETFPEKQNRQQQYKILFRNYVVSPNLKETYVNELLEQKKKKKKYHVGGGWWDEKKRECVLMKFYYKLPTEATWKTIKGGILPTIINNKPFIVKMADNQIIQYVNNYDNFTVMRGGDLQKLELVNSYDTRETRLKYHKIMGDVVEQVISITEKDNLKLNF